MAVRIASIEQLKKEAAEGAEFFILLNHGLKSSKNIVWDEDEKLFHIFNLIDETEQCLTEAQLMDRSYSNIGYAIQKGALFKEDW